MNGLLNLWILLVVLLQEHLQGRKRNTQHVSELLRVNIHLFSLEHARLHGFELVDAVDVGVVVHAELGKFTLFLFAVHCVPFVVLPLVVDLVVDQPVSLLKIVSNLDISL